MNPAQSLGRPGIRAELRRFLRLLGTDRGAALERLRRGLGVVRAKWVFRGCEIGDRVNVLGPIHLVREGRISVGERVQFWEGMIAHELACGPGAEIAIGASTVFNYGTALRASRSIRVGKRCMFGSMVMVCDSTREKTAPIVIGDDVWVAHGAVIEPGVTIGDGSVVGAGSVVTRDVPPRSLAVGNPAVCTPLNDSGQRTTG